MIEKTPLISVIVPMFNSKKWVEQSLCSLLAQSYANFEIIVYDDGSTDNGLDVIKRLKDKKNRIRIIHSDRNQGIVTALNTLIRESTGEYIARMDADDIAHPNRLEKQVNFMLAESADLCGSWFKEIGQGLRRVTRWPTTHEALEAAFLFQNSICHPTAIARRCVFDDFPYRNNFSLAEDYDFFLRAIQKYKLANVPEALLSYRRHSAQATQSKRDQMEAITESLRINALNSIGIHPTNEQARIHNLIRAPHSITSIQDLNAVETWLFSLLNHSKSPDFNSVIANQWIRACIRSAPLGFDMFRKFLSSDLLAFTRVNLQTKIDIAAIAALHLKYNSSIFRALRRVGLSA